MDFYFWFFGQDLALFYGRFRIRNRAHNNINL